jgi:hypothetical protein
VRRAEVESFNAASRLIIDIEDEAGFDSRWNVRLESPDVAASHGFWSGAEPENLVEFFADLARNWRGWTGDKVLSTAEHDLGLRATHDSKGHVLLWVRLGPNVADIDKTWHVVAPLALEGGALDRIAAQVRAGLTDS